MKTKKKRRAKRHIVWEYVPYEGYSPSWYASLREARQHVTSTDDRITPDDIPWSRAKARKSAKGAK